MGGIREPAFSVSFLLQEASVKEKKKKPGIIYLSSIPEVRNLFT
jgi:hypothetical protein